MRLAKPRPVIGGCQRAHGLVGTLCQVITLTDCTAATSVAEHENAICYDYRMFSEPVTAADVVAEVS